MTMRESSLATVHEELRAPYHLFWISDMTLTTLLHGATWLNTTRELRHLGWKVTLISPGFEGVKEIRGVKVHGILRPERFLLRHLVYQFKVIRLILSKDPSIDVILFNELPAVSLLLLKFLLRSTGNHCPLFILDTRSLQMPPRDKMGWKDILKGFFLDGTNRLANYAADGRTTITPRMAEVLQIPDANLLGTWPSGVDPDAFGSSPQWPSDLMQVSIRLIYIGSTHYERNLMALTKAVVRAHAQAMKFELVIIGEGEEFDDLRRFARRTGGVVQVSPPVPHCEIPALLQQAHLGVLPFPDEMKFRVSSPIKLFEYMAAGLPILATRIVCHEDVIQDGSYVFWADGSHEDDLLNSLKDIWSRRGNLQVMGEQAALAVQEWTWKKSAEKLDRALKSALYTGTPLGRM